MISYDKDLLGKEVRGTNTSYWGISALQAGHPPRYFKIFI